MRVSAMLPALLLFVACGDCRAQDAGGPASVGKPLIFEFYYRVKWGYLDEFLELYKKNHLPILKKQMERGDILAISAAFPINHAAEEDRWDFRVTVTYRDAIVAHADVSDEPWVKEMIRDKETFDKEERRRFELLLEHTDIPIAVEDAAKW